MRMRKWAWAGLILTGVNCVAILDGDHPYREGDTTATGAPCTTDAECDDQNPCTTNTCSQDALVCEYVTQADGLAPDSAQTAADCQQLQCVGGKPEQQEDPQDILNDNNSCTIDSCSDGTPINEVLADNSPCTQGETPGFCNFGVCEVGCVNNNDCNDGNPCTDDLCNTSASKCVFTQVDGLPTPGVTPVVGDCKVNICDNGIDTAIFDDADVNDDGNPCTTDICTAGTPSNAPVPERTLCIPGEVQVCTSAGNCVECVVAEDCVTITETECEKRSCVNNTCQIAYEGQTTLASPVLQTPKDCQKVVCNGNLGTTSIGDNADLPDDGNPCTTDICSNGAPLFTNKTVGTSCGANQVCNSTGGCVGCNAPTDCAGTDDFCKTRTCINSVCGVSYTANGTDLPTGQTTGDCKVLECNGAGSVKTSVLTTDVPVDGNACTQDLCSMAGNPSNPATPINSVCSVGANDACDGNGSCKKSLGKTCAASAECVSANCVDGVCCNSSCSAACKACNVAGSLGTCSNVPAGSPDNNPVNACTGMNQCDGMGVCKRLSGAACAANADCLSSFCVDNVCCNSACTTTCLGCNVAGSLGTCTNLPLYTDDTTCNSAGTCDGAGSCKFKNGEICQSNANCASNNCVNTTCAP